MKRHSRPMLANVHDLERSNLRQRRQRGGGGWRERGWRDGGWSTDSIDDAYRGEHNFDEDEGSYHNFAAIPARDDSSPSYGTSDFWTSSCSSACQDPHPCDDDLSCYCDSGRVNEIYQCIVGRCDRGDGAGWVDGVRTLCGDRAANSLISATSTQRSRTTTRESSVTVTSRPSASSKDDASASVSAQPNTDTRPITITSTRAPLASDNQSSTQSASATYRTFAVYNVTSVSTTPSTIPPDQSSSPSSISLSHTIENTSSLPVPSSSESVDPQSSASDSTSIPSAPLPDAPTSSSNLQTSAVIGVVVACLCLLGCVLVGLYICWMRRKRARDGRAARTLLLREPGETHQIDDKLHAVRESGDWVRKRPPFFEQPTSHSQSWIDFDAADDVETEKQAMPLPIYSSHHTTSPMDAGAKHGFSPARHLGSSRTSRAGSRKSARMSKRLKMRWMGVASPPPPTPLPIYRPVRSGGTAYFSNLVGARPIKLHDAPEVIRLVDVPSSPTCTDVDVPMHRAEDEDDGSRYGEIQVQPPMSEPDSTLDPQGLPQDVSLSMLNDSGRKSTETKAAPTRAGSLDMAWAIRHPGPSTCPSPSASSHPESSPNSVPDLPTGFMVARKVSLRRTDPAVTAVGYFASNAGSKERNTSSIHSSVPESLPRTARSSSNPSVRTRRLLSFTSVNSRFPPSPLRAATFLNEDAYPPHESPALPSSNGSSKRNSARTPLNTPRSAHAKMGRAM